MPASNVWGGTREGQSVVQPLAMVLAGPLLNWAVGLWIWRALPAVSPQTPQRWWLLWLLLAYKLLVAAGYPVFCGLAGFGDWAVAASALLPTRLRRRSGSPARRRAGLHVFTAFSRLGRIMQRLHRDNHLWPPSAASRGFFAVARFLLIMVAWEFIHSKMLGWL